MIAPRGWVSELPGAAGAVIQACDPGLLGGDSELRGGTGGRTRGVSREKAPTGAHTSPGT